MFTANGERGIEMPEAYRIEVQFEGSPCEPSESDYIYCLENPEQVIEKYNAQRIPFKARFGFEPWHLSKAEAEYIKAKQAKEPWAYHDELFDDEE